MFKILFSDLNKPVSSFPFIALVLKTSLHCGYPLTIWSFLPCKFFCSIFFKKITFYLWSSFEFRRTSLSLLMVHVPTLQLNINLDTYFNPMKLMEGQRAQTGCVLSIGFGLTGRQHHARPISEASLSISSFLGISMTSQLLSGYILSVVTYIIAQPPWRKESVAKLK